MIEREETHNILLQVVKAKHQQKKMVSYVCIMQYLEQTLPKLCKEIQQKPQEKSVFGTAVKMPAETHTPEKDAWRRGTYFKMLIPLRRCNISECVYWCTPNNRIVKYVKQNCQICEKEIDLVRDFNTPHQQPTEELKHRSASIRDSAASSLNISPECTQNTSPSGKDTLLSHAAQASQTIK